MAFTTDPIGGGPARAHVLGQLRQRLESIHGLAGDMQRELPLGRAEKIEAATAKLETVAQEFKLLVEEYDRLPATDEDDPRLATERRALRETVAGLARSSALAGGMLERLVAVSRGRLGLLGGTQDGTYLPSGRAPELDTRGVRLKEWV